MTTLAIESAPLRALFTRLDFDPRPKSSDLTKVVEYWREKRRGRVAAQYEELATLDLEDASSRMFIYEAIPPRDYHLAAGRPAIAAVLGSCDIGEGLLKARNRRVAVRLRRLFDRVLERGEPVLAEFGLNEHNGERLIEVFAAPLAKGEAGKAAIFGGIAVRNLDRPAGRHQGRRRAESQVLLFSLRGSRELGEAIARELGIGLSSHEERDFEDGEHKVRPLVAVRDRDVFVLQNLAGTKEQSVNDRLCRLLFFIGALKDAGAARVTAVVPYLCYSRKDRKTKSQDPVSTRYVAQLFEAVGADRLITMEAHNLAAFQNAFRRPTDHLDANMVLANHFAALLADEPMAVVSPDLGGAKRAELFRERLEATLRRSVGKAVMDKQRSSGKVTGELFAGDVADRTVILLDDLVSTGTTMARAAAACRANGAAGVHIAATHGLFSTGAPATLCTPDTASIVITDTVPLQIDKAAFGDRLVVLSVAPCFAEAISGRPITSWAR